VGLAFSTRIGITVKFFAKALWTSRWTCFELFALSEKISTITREPSMASMIAAPHSTPGATSRGAIQQRTPLDSNLLQSARAVSLSSFEWLMKTSCGMGGRARFSPGQPLLSSG
jgi:hypothetical protein